MFAPMRPDCHRKTADLLEELAAREPDRVRIQVFDMMTPEGRAETNRERLRCATVLVNNRYHFALSDGDAERNVQFHRRPNSPNAMYNSEDVVAVAEQELKRLYSDETVLEQE
jgi:hypothetical protein